MKIKEAVSLINETDSFVAKYKNGCLFVFSVGEENHFVEFDGDQTSFLNNTDFSGMEIAYSADPEELLEVLEIIRELVETPVNERFPEKEYRLRWIDSKVREGPATYLGRTRSGDSIYWSTFSVFGAEVFTESELEQLKKDNPRLAPAIDAMKEPAEDKDDE